MNPSLILYALVLAVVIGLILFFIKGSASNTTTTKTTTINVSTSIFTNTTNTSTAASTTIPNYNYSGCIKPGPVASIPNGNFSTGNFSRWNATPNGFVVYNITKLNSNQSYYSSPWAGYNGTYFASTYNIGTVVRNGNLTSYPLLITQPYLDFKVVSPADSLLYVELLRNSTVLTKVHLNSYAVPNNIGASSYFENASITLIPYLCQTLKIRVVSAVSGNKNNRLHYIAVTNFHLSKLPQASPNIIVNQT